MFVYRIISYDSPGPAVVDTNSCPVQPPVLIRELMVWCWQQDYDERPSADSIIEVAHSDQFLRLADAIRINNFQSQATGSCYRIVRRRSLR